MNRSEFERLYVNFAAQKTPQTVTEIGELSRIDWDTFDQLHISDAPERILSREMAIADVAQMFVLFRYAYNGYEYYSVCADFVRLQDQLLEALEEALNPCISSLDFCKLMSQMLSPYINDGHVGIEYGNYAGSFLTSCIPYVTEVILEKKSECYTVIRGDGCLHIGDVLHREDIQGELFRTLIPDKDCECYLVGKYTHENISDIEIDGQRYKTHVLRCCQRQLGNKTPYSLKEESNYCLFINSTFQIYEEEGYYKQKFLEAGKKCSSKDFVVWDLCNNHGGNSKYPEIFLRSLNGCIYDGIDLAVLKSPVVRNSDMEKYYAVEMASERDSTKACYDGTMYIVMNKETGSSAELAVSFAKACRKVVTVGAPSAGIGLFGEVRPYRLRNSGIRICLPCKVFYEDNFEIGRGYLPDYWIDHENPAEYLMECLGKQ